MNILYVIHNLGSEVPESMSTVTSGGSERFTYALAHRLSSEHTCYILYTNVLGPENMYLHKISNFRNECLKAYVYNTKFHKLANFRNILEEYQIDVVHYQHLIHAPVEYVLISKSMGVKSVLSVHDYYYVCDEHFLQNDKFCTCDLPTDLDHCVACLHHKSECAPRDVYNRREIMQELLQTVDKVVAPSKSVRSDYFKLFPHINDKLSVIPIGIQYPPYLGVRNMETLNIGIPNYITHIKGQIPMINVIRICEEELPDVKFHFLCEAMEPQQEKYLKQFSNVVLNPMGFKDVNLIWLPTIAKETFSLVASETMARGLPILCSRKGALGERLTDSYAYFVENPLDVESIVKQIMSINASKHELGTKSEYLIGVRDSIPSIDCTVLQYEGIYDKLAANVLRACSPIKIA